MARTLSDEAWADICAAARGLTPDDAARAMLSAVLFEEYPAMGAIVSDRAHVKGMHDRARKIGNEAAKLAASIRQQMKARRRPPVSEDNDPLWRDLRHAHVVFQSARNQMLGYRAIRRDNKGKKNTPREWLISRLCGIWLDHFHANGLSITRGGPLIRFMLAAMRQIMPQEALPDRETVRGGIKRERNERAVAAQLSFEFKLRKATKGVD